MRIAFLGTRGVPARYGGFETAVEEVGTRLAARGHEVTVYCRNPRQSLTYYRGVRCVNLPALRRKSLETLTHTALSTAHAIIWERPEAIVLFNAANAPLIPALRAARIPTAIHVDGLEWKRAKWHALGRRYYRSAERWSVALADAAIADSRGIQAHIARTYHRRARYISYGAKVTQVGNDRLREFALASRSYHLVVARWEPENQVEMIVRGYSASKARHPLVVVGSSPYSEGYSRTIYRAASGSEDRVLFLGGIYDQELLDQLYGNCLLYLHGHSVGGTNPSLLRAMGAGAPVAVFAVDFNEEVVGPTGYSFHLPDDITRLIESTELEPERAIERGGQARDRVARLYRWEDVVNSYETLMQEIAGRRLSRS